ncbi:MAG: hypothetical protein IJR68_06545 [Fretibacterium sp.]|nr:hypothetical protein [Fretibacterium sp.]
MLKDKINAEIKKIEDHWNGCIKDMEENPERLAPDFKSLNDYRQFALENRAESAIVPLRTFLRKVEDGAENDRSEKNREFFRRLLTDGEIVLGTGGWEAYIPGERYHFSGDMLRDKLPGDGKFEAQVRNAHMRTSEILGYSAW